MRTIRFVLSFLLVTILSSLVIGASTSVLGSEPQIQPHKEWNTFTHPEFGFSFSYPTNWYLKNNLSLDNPSGTVSVVSADPESLTNEHSASDAMTIEIGLHLVEWNEIVTPREWLNAYSDAVSNMTGRGDTKVNRVVDLKVDGYPAVRKTATSPILTYDVVNVQRGKMVWFIWSNVVPEHQEVFEQVVQSFHWNDKNLPQNFSNMGIIMPVSKLNISERTLLAPKKETTKKTGEETTITPPSIRSIPGDPPGYRMPFNSGYYITAGPGSTCGSPNHTGSAARAIDFGTPNGTSIRNSSNGTVYFNGWDNTGYGNLVGVQDGSNRIAWYAHLSSRTYSSVGSYIGQGSWVGNSGRSGCGTCGYHLHFHVRTTAYNPVDITGIPTMTWYGDGCTGYPDGWAQYTP